MHERTVLGFSLASLWVLGAIAYIAEFGTNWGLAALLSGSVIIAATFLVRSNIRTGKYPIGHLAKVARVSDRQPYSVRRIENEFELRRLSQVDQHAYGDESVSYEFLLDFWRTYPNGLWCIWRGEEAVGAVEIWPLSKRAFHDICAGRHGEKDLTGASFDTSELKRYWYIGGIFLIKGTRCTDAVRSLINVCLSDWLSSRDLAPTIHVCAIAASERGENMLRRFGFRRPMWQSRASNRKRIFVRYRVNVQHLKQEWNSLLRSSCSPTPQA